MLPEDNEAAGHRRALALAWRALSRRDHTVAELRALLERRGVEPAAADGALVEVAGAGYLDDAGFARRFVEDRRRLDRWGEKRIARALERRGIAPELVREVLPGRGAEAELEAARALLAQRVPVGPVDDRGRQRALGLLMRRGYDAEVANEAVRRHERETSSGLAPAETT
ncbi:MAG TPA: regulatory protein RecX [Thermoleophilaceae bacterium]|nr:regulatory protein RecX [Thermoleophilaceae bacterium]